MWFVYVLRCADDSLYVGMTGDLDRRLRQHERGSARWTRTRLPVSLVHVDKRRTRAEARARERYLKSGWGKQWLKQKLEGV